MSFEEFLKEVIEGVKQYVPLNLMHIDLQHPKVGHVKNICEQESHLILQKACVPLLQDMHTGIMDYYKLYQSGVSIKTIVFMIMQEVAGIDTNGFPASLMEVPYEWVKEHLLVGICNAEMNQRLFGLIPFDKKGDFALRYLLFTKNADKSYNTVLVNNEHLEKWGVSEEALKRDAWENTKKKFPPVVQSLNEAINELLEEGCHAEDITAWKEEDMLYVLHNEAYVHGACYMLDREIMDHLAERFDDDLIIFPSSVHEFLFMRRKGREDFENFANMVREVNHSVVGPEEILSDNVYIYDRKTHNIASA